MKPITPHDRRDESLDDLIAAALHGELTPEERTQFEARLSNDPAARAAYQEAQAMHDLLEKTHRTAQPDPNFEQRMVSGVRRKLQTEKHTETAWESVLVLWAGLRSLFRPRSLYLYGGLCSLMLVLCLGFVIYSGNQVKGVFTTITSQLAMAESTATPPKPQFTADNFNVQAMKQKDLRQVIQQQGIHYTETAQKGITLSGYVDSGYTQQFGGKAAPIVALNGGALAVSGENTYTGGTTITSGNLTMGATTAKSDAPHPAGQFTDANGLPAITTINAPTTTPPPLPPQDRNGFADDQQDASSSAFKARSIDTRVVVRDGETTVIGGAITDDTKNGGSDLVTSSPTVLTKSGEQGTEEAVKVLPTPIANDTTTPAAPALGNTAPSTTAAIDTRKLIRNAQLDLEVKSFQTAMDQISALTRSAGGYIDTSNSQKGGNGKLQGTVVVKVLPQNLDAYLLRLRDLGQVQNQSVSTDDVTKDYFDTQARLENSRRMETQLQQLLQRENGKVSDLLAVERELGRVRGDIEQMQGQLKLYDFQVQYATITIQMREKDLNQAAAYLLKEQDDFSLFATDVEGTFQKARQTADAFKAQVLTANLNHNSGSDVSAELEVMVAPDQVEAFLSQVRGLGRVANFTRETQRVAKDGGDSDQPADETLTEKDKVQVHLAIRSDDETRKQVALTVVAKAVDGALDEAKAAALANAGVEILSSSLNKTPEGASTAQLSVRVPGKEYSTLIAAFNELGRTASLSIQRNDNSGPGTNGDDAPVIISLSLTDDDTPLQETAMTVRADDVDSEAQQIKKDAGAAGVEVKASSFERQPDGTELAQMTFRLPMAKYPAFVESVKKLGKVESLTVQRQDRPDQTLTDGTAPVEITLQLHNERDLVPDNTGFFATLRNTFMDGASALLGSVRVIGVLVAFTAPWLFTLGLLAWIGRRIYVWRKR